jgi:EAL domain-containing protein (putative c-di-GMP-specific phosphodiesterase class I)
VSIRDIGVGLKLDDFGTGYASLNCLTQLPISGIKIDRSFVQGCRRMPAHAHLLQSMIAMARGIGLTVVAEGVESESEAIMLRQYHCNEAQGYFWSGPLQPEAFHDYLVARNTHPATAAAQTAASQAPGRIARSRGG